jgi:hypothetical protein
VEGILRSFFAAMHTSSGHEAIPPSFAPRSACGRDQGHHVAGIVHCGVHPHCHRQIGTKVRRSFGKPTGGWPAGVRGSLAGCHQRGEGLSVGAVQRQLGRPWSSRSNVLVRQSRAPHRHALVAGEDPNG